MARYARVAPQHRTPSAPGSWELLLFHQDGVVSRRQARRYFSEAAVRHRLETGRWRLALPGVYVTHSGPVTVEQRPMIASLAVGAGSPALLGGLSALAHMGLRGFAHEPVHVLLPWRRRAPAPAPWVVVHRTRHLSPEEARQRATPPHTREVRSLIDAAAWARTDDQAVAIIAAGYQQRFVAGDEIARALEQRTRVPRRPLILAAAADAAGGAHSLPEQAFARGLRRSGLPQPTRQVVRRDSTGRRRYLDASFDDYGLHIEVDGSHHLDVQQWWADMRRQNALWVAGERVLRFPAPVIRHREDEWLEQVRAALIAAGWRPGN